MDKFKVLIAIFFIFILGATAGVLGSKLYFKYRLEQAVKVGPPPLMRHMLMRKMVHDLNLSERQRGEVEKILRQTEIQLARFREKYRPEFEKIMDESIARVKERLNEEQKKRLDLIYQKIRARGRMGYHGHGQPCPPIREETLDYSLIMMKNQLNLNEEQTEKLRQIIGEIQKKKHTILKNYREEEEKIFYARQKDLEAIDQETERLVAAIFTEKQLKEYQKIKKEWHMQPMCPARTD